ncbi:hypothetical protein L3X38_034712 [Prunus dulcis]|uniref:DUF4218 domain-containing protein n=1 Tax=Prunus dulcis TaxID=3755 RepID=A0AAD4VIK6_PRUDU|nr:hypothetical protein L3X38_034712 [Prunus dulcis]
MFTLLATVMWTVNDFPAYAMVSGWSTNGYMACPVCKEDVTSGWHAGKVCYIGHRRWLPWDHEWGEKDKEFDGNTERRLRPREWSGDEILEQLNRLDFASFGKTVSRTRPSTHLNWTHKPMFFELPYWSKLKLRHNLDVMHVEKNVFDTLVGTILDIEGKTKDTIKARLDLERMGIRRGLWMNRDSDKARRDLAFFSMKPDDKKEFLKFVSSVKIPDGYASNIARCVNVDGGKFTGLKSHDCHVFMQRLRPVGIRHLLPEDVVKPIMLLCKFFSQLTAKTLRRTDMFQLRHDIVQVLCKFEMIFPPAFFTSMMHVMVHLPEEALLAGPVNYRWMYPIERLLGWLKKSMSDLIRRGRSMTTAPSSDPPAQSASAATAPALLDHVVVGPGASQAPASSASSVAQPASARRRHRPTDTIDTTSTDGTGASGSQPAKKNTRGPCRQLKTVKVTRVTNNRISIGYDERHRAAPTAELRSSLAHDIGHVVWTHCPMQWKSWRVLPDEIKVEVRGQLSTNYNLEDLDEESVDVNRLFAERYKQWKSDLHHHFLAFDDSQVTLQEGCPKELEGPEDSWEWLCAHFQAPEFVVFF